MAVISLSDDPVPMTDEQKFLFDLKGWLLLPGVLEPTLLDGIRNYLRPLSRARETLGLKFMRYSMTGPAQELIDHPAIVGILRAVIGADQGPGAYGFRCESSFFVDRGYGEAGFQEPHCGPSTGPFSYHVQNGTIWSGLTRVVWELTDVRKGEGGTPVMSGSHKSNFQVPEAYRQYDPSLYEGYSCPAGSVLIFSENCWHYGVEWRNRAQNRLAVFNCYNSYLAQWHKCNLPSELIEAMPQKRRSAFRGVWARDIRERKDNDYYSDDNRAL